MERGYREWRPGTTAGLRRANTGWMTAKACTLEDTSEKYLYPYIHSFWREARGLRRINTHRRYTGRRCLGVNPIPNLS